MPGASMFFKITVKITIGKAITKHKDMTRILKIQESEPGVNSTFNKIKQMNSAAN